MHSQLRRDVLHEGGCRPLLLEEVVEGMNRAMHEVLLFMVHHSRLSHTRAVHKRKR